jgi:hypothetical protein
MSPIEFLLALVRQRLPATEPASAPMSPAAAEATALRVMQVMSMGEVLDPDLYHAALHPQVAPLLDVRRTAQRIAAEEPCDGPLLDPDVYAARLEAACG